MKTLKIIAIVAIIGLVVLLCAIFGGFAFISFQDVITGSLFNLIPALGMLAVCGVICYMGFLAAEDVLEQ